MFMQVQSEAETVKYKMARMVIETVKSIRKTVTFREFHGQLSQRYKWNGLQGTSEATKPE